MISRPTISLTRIGLASALLVFGVNLTSLVLEVDSAWHIVPKPHTPVTQLRPKDQTPGRPSKECLEALAASPHFLDYAVLHLPVRYSVTFEVLLDAKPSQCGHAEPAEVDLAWPAGIDFCLCRLPEGIGVVRFLSRRHESAVLF